MTTRRYGPGWPRFCLRLAGPFARAGFVWPKRRRSLSPPLQIKIIECLRAGESYADARRHVLSQADPNEPVTLEQSSAGVRSLERCGHPSRADAVRRRAPARVNASACARWARRARPPRFRLVVVQTKAWRVFSCVAMVSPGKRNSGVSTAARSTQEPVVAAEFRDHAFQGGLSPARLRSRGGSCGSVGLANPGRPPSISANVPSPTSRRLTPWPTSRRDALPLKRAWCGSKHGGKPWGILPCCALVNPASCGRTRDGQTP